MDAYCIGSRAFPLLDGAGAAGSDDARWNSRGRYVIYAAEHYAAALLEKAAQLNSVRIPRSLVYIRIAIPTDVTIEAVGADDLPGWSAADKTVARRFGDRWYDEQRTLILLVPSLTAPGLERHVLVNQRHHEFPRIRASGAEPVRCHPALLV